MKKIAMFLAILVLAGGTAFAKDDGIGLTVGMGIGLDNPTKANDGDSHFELMVPDVKYENSFLDGALDVLGEFEYYLFFNN
jgi:hypothetical protein